MQIYHMSCFGAWCELSLSPFAAADLFHDVFVKYWPKFVTSPRFAGIATQRKEPYWRGRFVPCAHRIRIKWENQLIARRQF